ncbi:MAG: hypothetical protein KDA86_03835 [Planctomycetaceae bacterium]|nr:hypothetical protein [Planctomycetaceae bacterium]
MSSGTSTIQERKSSAVSSGEDLQPSKDLVQYMKDYAREKPDVAALWCFGVGFVIGWKLKPW